MNAHVFPSYEQQLIAGYSAATARLGMAPVPKPIRRPVLVQVRPDADQHVIAYRTWQKMQAKGTMPAEFVRLACDLFGYDHTLVMSESRTRKSVIWRYDLIRMTAARYPKMSSPKLGRIFDRDHTVVLYALHQDGRVRKNTAKLDPEQVRTIKLKARSGVMHKDIAKEYGVVPSTISNIVNGRVWRGVE